MRPLIGISLRLGERARWNPTREYAYLETGYARALADAGATPLLLPIQDDIASLVDRLDGLLIPAATTSSRRAPIRRRSASRSSPLSLAFDRALLAAARERALPVLGICYGMQLLALERGGKLIFDIPTDVPLSGPHRLPGSDGHHGLALESGSQLARVLGDAAGP